MKKKSKVSTIELADGNVIAATAEAVEELLAEARWEARREAEEHAYRMAAHQQARYRDHQMYGGPDYYRGRDVRPPPPMEPDELEKARKKIADEWEEEFQFAQNLRAALQLAIEMCDEGEDLEEVRDMCQDALTDQASPRLRNMRDHARRMDHLYDPAVQKHKQRIPNMPVHKPSMTKFHHHYEHSEDVPWGAHLAKTVASGPVSKKSLTTLYEEVLSKFPDMGAGNPCKEQVVEDDTIEVEEFGTGNTIAVHVDKVTNAQGEAFWISSTSNTAQ